MGVPWRYRLLTAYSAISIALHTVPIWTFICFLLFQIIPVIYFLSALIVIKASQLVRTINGRPLQR